MTLFESVMDHRKWRLYGCEYDGPHIDASHTQWNVSGGWPNKQWGQAGNSYNTQWEEANYPSLQKHRVIKIDNCF